MSIIDVANSAGVSKATVSRVINRRAGVSPDTTQAIEEAMRRVGYVVSANRP